MNERIRNDAAVAALQRALESGLIVVDAHGQIVWMAAQARRNVDGQLRQLELPLRMSSSAVRCFLSAVELDVGGTAEPFCVLQVIADPSESARDLHSMIDSAIAEVMADPSWLARPLGEKIKAWCQAAQPTTRAADIEVLTAREREILSLICDGLADAEMGRTLGLSQNTVRNHVASLFRKIGVNRRSAAIIWARERGITRYDVEGRSRHRRSPSPDQE